MGLGAAAPARLPVPFSFAGTWVDVKDYLPRHSPEVIYLFDARGPAGVPQKSEKLPFRRRACPPRRLPWRKRWGCRKSW